MITLTWHGHSCWSATFDGYTLVIDPYGPDTVPGLAPLALTANEVLCSHEHSDHGYREAVKLLPGGPSPFKVTALDTWHDDQKGALRGPNKIFILEAGGLRIAHLGDLGCRPADAQLAALKDLDALLVPVGGHYTIGPEEARDLCEILHPRVILPMHYTTDDYGYPVLARLAAFTDLMDNVTYSKTNTFEIARETPAQTAVLTYLG